jgi:alanyl-tRNA synthetase
VARVDDVDADGLKQMAVSARDGINPGVVVVAGSPDGGKVAIVVAVSKELTDRVTAGELAQTVARAVGGGAGKAIDLAVAGGRDPSKLSQALETVADQARSALAQ